MTTEYKALNASNTKVGDEVAFYRNFSSGWGDSYAEKGFGKVTKINGHGHITVEIAAPPATLGENPPTVKVFDKHGDERGRGNYGCRLCNAEYLRESLDATAKRHRIDKAVEALVAAIESKKARYGGRYHTINEATKNEWRALIDAIENSDE